MSNKHDLIAGIGPTGLCENFEVKILICYVMFKVDKPVNIEELKDILVFTGLANYFVFIQSINELLELEHIKKNKDCYELTEKGKKVSDIFTDTIPESVKEKTVEYAGKYFRIKEYDKKEIAVVEELETGYNIILNVGDNDSSLMEIKLFVPDKKYCDIIKDNFYENPELVYKVILSLLTDDMNSVYTALAQKMFKFPKK